MTVCCKVTIQTDYRDTNKTMSIHYCCHVTVCLPAFTGKWRHDEFVEGKFCISLRYALIRLHKLYIRTLTSLRIWFDYPDCQPFSSSYTLYIRTLTSLRIWFDYPDCQPFSSCYTSKNTLV